jgi:hypothetical protein
MLKPLFLCSVTALHMHRVDSARYIFTDFRVSVQTRRFAARRLANPEREVLTQKHAQTRVCPQVHSEEEVPKTSLCITMVAKMYG